MAHLSIEYMIMVPILVLQILLFPIAASWLMNGWVDSRRTLALQGAADHMGSSIQQTYLALNHETIPPGTIIKKFDTPPLIEDHYYTGFAALWTVQDSVLNASKVLEIRLKLENTRTTVTTQVLLGQNALWQDSFFMSNSTNACITAVKFWDGDEYLINFFFGG